jgi:hypothetical protein
MPKKEKVFCFKLNKVSKMEAWFKDILVLIVAPGWVDEPEIFES